MARRHKFKNFLSFMKIQIKNRWNDLLIFETDAESLGAAILAAIAAKTILSDANLSGANLSGAKLSGANLSGANLCDANLCGANLSDANLCGANLSDAKLSGANLIDANLCGANLSDANLSGANLSGAKLSGANLIDANLCDANLCGANLSDANLSGAKNFDLAKELSRRTILPEGELIGYKKLSGGTICKLKIPATSKRIGGLIGRKCRAEFAVVLEGEGESQHGSNFVYKVGETIVPDSFDENPLVECSNGIHFFITRAEAEAY
jgi:uncharacterized protein YjbI with pentapeptide repeats